MIRLAPDLPDAYVNLARLLVARRRLEEARPLLSVACGRFPDDPRIIRELGALCEAEGDLVRAGEYYQRAAHALPEDLRAHHLYAEAVRRLGGFAEAIPIYRRCLDLDPGDAEVMNNLSVVLRLEGQLGEALQLARRAVDLKPDLVEARASVADALTAMGRATEADSIYADLIEHSTSGMLTNHLLTAAYVDSVSAEVLAERHWRFGDRYAAQVPTPFPHPNARQPDRPLRVGYLSGDFRLHSVSYFFEPVLERHDTSQFEVFCYHTQAEQDEVTARLRRHARAWVQAERLSDEALADRIRADGIDILVDLAGHTAGNRIFTLARKPAPIQALWLGYPTTSGLPTMDYRISDRLVDPPGTEHLNRERLVRLPDSYYCYRPMADAPGVTPLPADAQGEITFGSFNNLAKMSDACISLWSRVLTAIPSSRLLLKSRGLTDPACTANVLGRFGCHGVGADRLRFEGWNGARGGHLALYAEVDVALDTFPYNGGTTTCEALWMGVPVVSLSGATHASRMGASLLHAAGLPDLVAGDGDDFVRKAIRLAGDRAGLAILCRSLRARLQESPLMDEVRFTRALESVYRQMWQRWCAPERP